MLQSPYITIIITSSIIGLIAGFIMHRSSFCVTSMYRDWFLFKNSSLLLSMILLIALSMLFFQIGIFLGLIKETPFPLLGFPALTTIIAGILFGLGMVMAGGCVVGTLYKMGAGSILSLVAFIGLLAGSTVYAEFHSFWAGLYKSTQFVKHITLPQLLNVSSFYLTLPLSFITLYYLYLKKKHLIKTSYAEGYIQPWQTAVILAMLGFFSYIVIGMPLGITTSYAKIGSAIESLFLFEHVYSQPYFTAAPLNYSPPFSEVNISGGAGPELDAIAAIQYPLVIFITLGATISAVLLKEFKIHYKLPLKQYMSVLIGGFILGMSARMVPGCNLWHLWGGIPILSLQSILFGIALIPGAWLGSKILAKYII